MFFRILFCLVCSVATTFITNKIALGDSNTTPIGFQFLTANHTPIPFETFQIQLDNETKSLTTKSDGLAIMQIPNQSLKSNYVITTPNQQTFTVEPNKLYQLTSTNMQPRNSPQSNNQSVTVDVLSNTYQHLSNMEVKLTANNQEFIGKTNTSGTTTINIPSNISKETQFNVSIQGIDTKSTMKIGEDKYYTYNASDKSVAPYINNTSNTDNTVNSNTTQVNSGQSNQANNNSNNTQSNNINNNQNSNINNNQSNTQNNIETYQISVAKDNLLATPARTKDQESKKEKKKTSSDVKKLPETGQNGSQYFKYIISFLLVSIATIIFFIFRRKRIKQQG